MKVPDDVVRAVRERDHNRCVCGDVADGGLHHVIPRSLMGKKSNGMCNSTRNIVCICKKHHRMAHTHAARCQLLRYLRAKFHYEYPEALWQQWLEDEHTVASEKSSE